MTKSGSVPIGLVEEGYGANASAVTESNVGNMQ